MAISWKICTWLLLAGAQGY